jgi:outer membrane protein OmpA-like peptidoglycan-associated protein
MKKQKQSYESVILASEVPLQKIAANMDVVAEFDNGYDEVTNEIINYVQQVPVLTEKLSQRDQQIAEYEEQLGGLASEQSELKQQMEAQAKIREQFDAIEKIFSKDEAYVLREGNDIIMRLIGLNFASGKSTIEPQYFSLLTKVQNAINTFPGSRIVIEGHTDSYGGDELNLRLSQERSDAVRQYLLANLRNISPSQIESVGYGENKPIANNETVEGRTKNRRIDIVIKPQMLGVME